MMASCSTLEEMQRQSPPFIVASLAALIASSIGMVGVLLALLGIYGTVSYIVVLRTREVGIRMAIGAQKSDVLGLILRESARPIFAGLIVGSLLAAGASYLARGLLFGLDNLDWISLTGVSLLFLIIGLLASYPPARRAALVDPLVALRYE
jgi:ABC-type antimicrobial peptide transport system permease subunit